MQRKIRSFLLTVAAVALLGSHAQAQQKFVAALNSLQQVPPAGSAARGTCKVTVFTTTAMPQLHVSCQYSGLSSGITSGHIHGNAAPGQTAGIVLNFNLSTTTTSGGFTFFDPIDITPAQVAEIRAKRWYIDLHTANFPNGEIRGQIKVVALDYDTDGDSRTDAIVYRPSNGSAYALRSTNNSFSVFNSGFATDTPIFADFDGDGIADSGVIRIDVATGAATTFINQSTDGFRAVQFGNAALNDQPALGDYDGDGKFDIAVYRVSNGIWYILQSSNNQPRYEYWGQPDSDLPCPGDYDRDGKTDLCVIRTENERLVWYIRRSSDNQSRRVVWGLSRDLYFPANPPDVDGDGATDIMVTRIANGQIFYYALRSSDDSLFALQWGLATDRIRFGDYDADGKTDFAALRAINNQLVWFVRQSSDNQTRVFNWGLPDDL